MLSYKNFAALLDLPLEKRNHFAFLYVSFNACEKGSYNQV